MSFRRAGARQQGLSLVELIAFIVIVSIAVLGVVQLFGLGSRFSADPLARKQALSIAESLLEEVELARFTYCDPDDTRAETATGAFVGAAGCALTLEDVGSVAGEARPFDNVNDYVSQYNLAQESFKAGGVLADANLAPVTLDAGRAGAYRATLTIVPEALGGIASGPAPADADVLRIRVEVFYGSTDSVVLEGYRVRYAPN
ncbi:MAG: type II secretion system protein [Telluria sp.]|nr:type II secretion system protein [Telluria sp.]